MSLRIYNTLKKGKEEFIPLEEGKVGMYVCGPTVYDDCHMGHARASIVFDVIFRYLKFKGYHVTYVRNITDIDDKIIRKANEEGVDFTVITKRYIKSFHNDMLNLGNKPPTLEPKATDHIPEIIEMINKLLDKGMAYQVEGDVYYPVEQFNQYGKLSGRNTEDMIAGVRIEVDERKKNPLDFALWKSSKHGEPSWDSPWGKGRPGWHIECSAMSCKHLGETFDIHGGGKDLIFPHHENEVAQSEAANEKLFVKYWVHNGFVNINEEKMSKSLGNFFTIRELLKLYLPEVIRFFLLTTHYRSPVDYTEQSLIEAEKALEKIYATLSSMDREISLGIDDAASASKAGGGVDADVEGFINSLDERFCAAMDDDFNTALAIASIFDTIRAINGWINKKRFIRTSSSIDLLKRARDVLSEKGTTIGILENKAEQFIESLQKLRKKDNEIDIVAVEKLIEERFEARKSKNWGLSDEIRDKLVSMNVMIKDGPQGTTWEIKR